MSKMMILRKKILTAAVVGVFFAAIAMMLIFQSEPYRASVDRFSNDPGLLQKLGRVECQFLVAFNGSGSINSRSRLNFWVFSDRGRFFVEFRYFKTSEGLTDEGVLIDGQPLEK